MKNFLKSVVRIFAIYFAVIAVVHLQERKICCNAETNPICLTKYCTKYANLLLKNLNKNRNPCDNFYDYVCHGWPAQFPRPPFKDLWHMREVIALNSRLIMKKLFENRAVTNITVHEQAKLLYRACLNLPFLPQSDPKKITEIMGQISVELQKDTTWYSFHNRYLQMTGESGLFEIALIANGKMNHQIIPLIKSPKSPYGMLRRTNLWENQKERDAYKNFLLKVILSILPENHKPSVENIVADINSVLDFRDELWKLIPPLDISKFQINTIKNVHLLYSSFPTLRATKLNWLPMIRSIYKKGIDPYGNLISENSLLLMQTTYFPNLGYLLAKTPEKIIAKHLHLYFAERHLILTPEMNSLLRESLNSECYEPGSIRYQIPRWMTCLKSNNMKVSSRTMFLNEAFQIPTKIAVENLIEEAKKIIAQQITESKWMSPSLKQELVEKAISVESVVGFPPLYNDTMENIRAELFKIDPLDPNAGYMKLKNRLYVTATSLQPPLYDLRYPYVLNYGATMFLIGHELYHAFDDFGVTISKNGEIRQLSPDMAKKYTAQFNCFKTYCENFKKNAYLAFSPNFRAQIPDTSREDMSDMMGLKLAFKGFKQAFNRSNGICPILPGFEDFGCEKLFFIAYANSFCAGSSLNGLKFAILVDKHSIEEVRVNAAVSNIKEFHKAFGCRPKDALYMKNTCDLW